VYCSLASEQHSLGSRGKNSGIQAHAPSSLPCKSLLIRHRVCLLGFGEGGRNKLLGRGHLREDLELEVVLGVHAGLQEDLVLNEIQKPHLEGIQVSDLHEAFEEGKEVFVPNSEVIPGLVRNDERSQGDAAPVRRIESQLRQLQEALDVRQRHDDDFVVTLGVFVQAFEEVVNGIQGGHLREVRFILSHRMQLLAEDIIMELHLGLHASRHVIVESVRNTKQELRPIRIGDGVLDEGRTCGASALRLNDVQAQLGHMGGEGDFRSELGEGEEGASPHRRGHDHGITVRGNIA